jgi:hypothetical protein
VVSAADAAALGALWYEGRLERDWRPRTNTETNALFARLNLTSSFWNV